MLREGKRGAIALACDLDIKIADMLPRRSLLQPDPVYRQPVRSLRKVMSHRRLGCFGTSARAVRIRHHSLIHNAMLIELSRGHPFRSPEHRPRDLLSTGARLSST